MRANEFTQDYAAGSCASAVSFYKLVAERGVWDGDIVNEAEEGWNSGTERGKEMAILRWWIAAERGYEIAQNNLAYVLDQGGSQSVLGSVAAADQNLQLKIRACSARRVSLLSRCRMIPLALH